MKIFGGFWVGFSSILVCIACVSHSSNADESMRKRIRHSNLLEAETYFREQKIGEPSIENAREVLNNLGRYQSYQNNIYISRFIISSAIYILAYSSESIEDADKKLIINCVKNYEKEGIMDDGLIIYAAAEALNPSEESIELYKMLIHDNENSWDYRIFALCDLIDLNKFSLVDGDLCLLVYGVARGRGNEEKILSQLQRSDAPKTEETYKKIKSIIGNSEHWDKIKKIVPYIRISNSKIYNNQRARLSAAQELADNGAWIFLSPKLIATGLLSNDEIIKKLANELIMKLKNSKDPESKDKLNDIFYILKEQNVPSKLLELVAS